MADRPSLLASGRSIDVKTMRPPALLLWAGLLLAVGLVAAHKVPAPTGPTNIQARSCPFFAASATGSSPLIAGRYGFDILDVCMCPGGRVRQASGEAEAG